MPFYLTVIIVIALGIDEILNEFHLRSHYKLAGAGLYLIIMVNLILTSFVGIKERNIEDTRIIGRKYCDEEGIESKNAISEAYTPFSIAGGKGIVEYFDLSEDGSIMPVEKLRDRRYVLLSDYKERYEMDQTMYAEECRLYQEIEKKYTLIYSLETTEIHTSRLILKNIFYCLDYLLDKGVVAGPDLYIYDMEYGG